jgi:hypothetical protein
MHQDFSSLLSALSKALANLSEPKRAQNSSLRLAKAPNYKEPEGFLTWRSGPNVTPSSSLALFITLTPPPYRSRHLALFPFPFLVSIVSMSLRF